MTTVIGSRAEFLAARAALTGTVGLVPTMGALHAGHESLMRAARAECDQVIATVFVNPLQFGPGEDLDRYPRTLVADVGVCERAGVDLVWAPGVADVYPAGQVQVTVHAGTLGDVLEGAVRPGHFDGVLTVVAKLLNIVRPARAYFGEKDYQQLTLIRRMAADLDLGAEIVGVPTVREPDGLALSSRNVYLSDAERATALGLSRALRAGAASADPEGAARAVLAEAGIEADYVALRSPELGEPAAGTARRLLVAARIGTTRLIDNVAVLP